MGDLTSITRQEGHRFRFGEFEIDLRTGELWKRGERILLQEKPFQVLVALLEKPGEMISREELRRRIWPDVSFMEFDHSLNVAVAKLRHALTDPADSPRFIETLVKRGYRFIRSVEHFENASMGVGAEITATQKKMRLAVLPFQTLGSSAKLSYFSQGLSDEIIIRLGHLYRDRLAVIARVSSWKYLGTAKEIAQIGQELRAEFIIAGTVSSLGKRTRAIAQLIRVDDQAIIWAESYDFMVTDTIVIQNKVAASVARSVGIELLSADGTDVSVRSTQNPQAHLAYLKGCFYQATRTEEGLKKSIEFFEQSMQLDSEYALAYSALANSLFLVASMGFGGKAPKELLPRAMAIARESVLLNDHLAECHTSLALAKYFCEWDWRAAEEFVLRAIQLNPSCAFAHRVYSYLLSASGREVEAIQEARRACELDPLSLSANSWLGITLYFSRQYEDAIKVLRNTLELDPNYELSLMWLGTVYAQDIMVDEGIALLEKARANHPGYAAILGSLGEVYVRAGRRDEACKLRDELILLSGQRYTPPFDVALILTALDQIDAAFQWLEKALNEHFPFLPIFLKDPRFDILRSDKRYHQLINRIEGVRSPESLQVGLGLPR